MVTQTAPETVPQTETQTKTRTATLAKPACVHHWMVPSPQGETSWGECRKCSRRKRFSNRFDGRDRANNSDLFSPGSAAWKPDRSATYRAADNDTSLAAVSL